VARTLILLGFLSLIALLATAALGFVAEFGPARGNAPAPGVTLRPDLSGELHAIERTGAARRVSLSRHIALAVLSAVLVLFTQSMTMFYFLGTGSRVKQGWRLGKIPEEAYRTSRSFHRRVFPLATSATALTMALVILGGGVHTGVLPPVTHWLLWMTALPVNAWAVWKEILAFAENEALLNSLDDVLPEA
jgi:hypothetical protein